jgi:hypothetical protein
MPYHALASPALAASSSGSSAVSIGVALACLAAAALLWFVGGHLPRVTLLLVITASTGLATVTIGGKNIHDVVDSLLTQFNQQVVSVVGAGISGLIGLILAYVVYIHWDRRQITYTTLAAAALLPMVAAATPGLGGRLLIWALGLISSLITGIAHMIGVH